jgi:hypothetical protein
MLVKVEPLFRRNRRKCQPNIDRRKYDSMPSALAAARHFANISQQTVWAGKKENGAYGIGYGPFAEPPPEAAAATAGAARRLK